MKSEAVVQTEVMLELSKRGARGWKNTSGVFRTEDGRTIRAGLGNISTRVNKVMKSSDIIAACPVTITPDMVGKTVAVFSAIECKKENHVINLNNPHMKAQENFLTLVRGLGGFGGFLSDVNQLDDILTL